MKIKIENYNNIKQLNYEIIENKINFLFGISGSGKSSIANALSSDISEIHVPYGMEIQPTITVNDKEINYDDFRVFNVDYMNNILIEKSEKEAVYNIILGENNNIQELKDEYLDAIKCLLNVKDTVYANAGKIQKLTNDLKISYQKDGNSYHSTCLVGKMTNNISKEKYVYVKNKKMSSSQIKWYIDGKTLSNTKRGNVLFVTRNCLIQEKRLLIK